MRLNEINPFIRVAKVFELNSYTKNDVFNNLITADCRLFYIISGGGSMIIDGSAYRLSEGCVVLFQSGTIYCWQPNSEGIRYVAVNFDYTQNFSHLKESFHTFRADCPDSHVQLERIEFSDATLLNSPIYLSKKSNLSSEFRALASEFYLSGKYCDEILSAQLKSLILRIARDKLTSGSSSENLTVLHAVELIQNGYMTKLTNEMIAERLGYHPTYLGRIFKEHTGLPIRIFILNYRLSIGADLLRDSKLSIEDVSQQAGFYDLPSFTKAFKNKYGITPSEYRKMN